MKTLAVKGANDSVLQTIDYLDMEGYPDHDRVRSPTPVTVVHLDPRNRVDTLLSDPFVALSRGLLLLHGWHALDATCQHMREGAPCAIVPVDANQAHFQINIEGQLDLMLITPTADLGETFFTDATALSMVLEYVATAIGRPMGVFYFVVGELQLQDPTVMDPLPSQTPADPRHGPVPIMGLPMNRWRRELDTLLKHGPEDCQPLDDPWLEDTVRPMQLVWKEYSGGGPDLLQRVSRLIEQVGSDDWKEAARFWLTTRGSEL